MRSFILKQGWSDQTFHLNDNAFRISGLALASYCAGVLSAGV